MSRRGTTPLHSAGDPQGSGDCLEAFVVGDASHAIAGGEADGLPNLDRVARALVSAEAIVARPETGACLGARDAAAP